MVMLSPSTRSKVAEVSCRTDSFKKGFLELLKLNLAIGFFYLLKENEMNFVHKNRANMVKKTIN
jgi:hypothetical protein